MHGISERENDNVRFEPKTEAEISAANLLEAGQYVFEVAKAEEKTSQNGNDMVKLTLAVFDNEDRRHPVFDYLVGTDGAAYKIRHFAESVGLLSQYEAGEIRAEQMEGRTGKCQVGIDDKNKQYPAKNIIRDYVPAGVSAPPKANGKSAPIIDDDLPF